MKLADKNSGIQKLTKKLETVSGQLTLIGLVFLATVVLGVVAICVRNVFFERYIRETFPPTTEELPTKFQDWYQKNEVPIKIEADELLILYGWLIEAKNENWQQKSASEADKKETYSKDQAKIQWLKRWFEVHGPQLRTMLAQTLRVGDRQQRNQALYWAEWLPAEDLKLLEPILIWTHERSRRRGETDLMEKVDRLRKL